MKKVCGVCHADSWADGYFENIDNTISDYNMAHEYTLALLNTAYEEELIDPSNPIDETPEVMYYYIWHHDGRRWRMGVSMMGPDWTHWNGAVDTLLDKLNTMEEWIKDARDTKALESKVADTEMMLEDTEAKLEEAETKLKTTEARLEELEGRAQSQTNPLLIPSGIIAVGIIIAAVILMQRDRT
jgi:hypothetical protein